MFKLSTVVVAALFSLGSMSAIAQTTPADHTQHHPAGSAPASTAQAPAPVPAAPAATAPASSDRMAAMEKQMQAMKAMREKLAAAKTPEERRAVFEEAAGITKYKSARREAMQKLALTDTNLARVADVIGEVARQIGSSFGPVRVTCPVCSDCDSSVAFPIVFAASLSPSMGASYSAASSSSPAEASAASWRRARTISSNVRPSPSSVAFRPVVCCQRITATST